MFINHHVDIIQNMHDIDSQIPMPCAYQHTSINRKIKGLAKHKQRPATRLELPMLRVIGAAANESPEPSEWSADVHTTHT